ncbi:MAG: hypothetical protein CO093_06535 [Alphaproteobacteria bacterium CG_4_9_14_3_um_filter_47_13]|nr:MAG: hypothetical protein CO093_06535 [Alphaproteobacteria bacterium CG_4_9_14_3_um_filter_47_13]
MKNLQRLCKTFNEASLALPHIIGIARPIGTGTYGLVIEHPDQTLTKILFRPRSVERTKLCQTFFVNELKALKLLAAHPVQDLQTPHLIGDVKFLRHKDYLAAFRMTKVEGTPCYLLPHNYDSAEILKEQHEKAGKALAKFHKASHQLPPGGVSKLPNLEYNKIFRVPYFSPKKMML